MIYTYTLPWGPSLSHYYLNARRTTRTGKPYMARMVSKAGNNFKAEVRRIVRQGHVAPPRLAGRLSITVLACAPTHARLDLDNRWKALSDALQAANVFINDDQLDEIVMVRGNVVAGGKMLVSIAAFDPDKAAARLAARGLAQEKGLL